MTLLAAETATKPQNGWLFDLWASKWGVIVLLLLGVFIFIAVIVAILSAFCLATPPHHNVSITHKKWSLGF